MSHFWIVCPSVPPFVSRMLTPILHDAVSWWRDLSETRQKYSSHEWALLGFQGQGHHSKVKVEKILCMIQCLRAGCTHLTKWLTKWLTIWLAGDALLATIILG